jgi:organic radical activating enzyme
MKKLRLLVTKKCNRACAGCCNKQFDLDNLEVLKSYDDLHQFDQIIITGGEPLLFGNDMLVLVNKIRKYDVRAEIILYTAKIDDFSIIDKLLPNIDGITVTLHEQYDIRNFLGLNAYLFEKMLQHSYYDNKSFRLNVFKGIKYYASNIWKVKDNIEWIEDCPLPNDEVFMRLENLY